MKQRHSAEQIVARLRQAAVGARKSPGNGVYLCESLPQLRRCRSHCCPSDGMEKPPPGLSVTSRPALYRAAQAAREESVRPHRRPR